MTRQDNKSNPLQPYQYCVMKDTMWGEINRGKVGWDEIGLDWIGLVRTNSTQGKGDGETWWQCSLLLSLSLGKRNTAQYTWAE